MINKETSECSSEIGASSQAHKHAFSETPMQSDQIVELAQSIRLLAFHIDSGERQHREELRNIRKNMEDIIYTIKGRK
jgi:hypothetical protein